jgi:hypothetical protein
LNKGNFRRIIARENSERFIVEENYEFSNFSFRHTTSCEKKLLNTNFEREKRKIP